MSTATREPLLEAKHAVDSAPSTNHAPANSTSIPLSPPPGSSLQCFFNSKVFRPEFTPVTRISAPLSSKIRKLNFFGIICVMYIHSFNEEPVYLQPATRPKENTFSVGIQFFLAAASLRCVVPFFFVVSGYLFFLCKSDDIPNVQFSRRIRARVWSILVPFFAWQLTAIVIVLLLLLWPAYKSNWPYYNQLQTWNLLDCIKFSFLQPPAFQLWYLRDLFIVACCSPVMFFLHRVHRLLLPFCLLSFLYPWFKNWFPLQDSGIYIINLDVMFFGWGAVLALNNLPIDRKPPTALAAAVIIVWLALCLLKTIMAYDAGVSDDALTAIYKLCILPGIPSFWWAADVVASVFKVEAGTESLAAAEAAPSPPSPSELSGGRANQLGAAIKRRAERFIDWARSERIISGYSLWLYCSHEPVMGSIVTNMLVAVVGRGDPGSSAGSAWSRMLMFVLMPLVWGSFLLALADMTSRRFPAVFGLLNGGRAAQVTSAKK